MLSICDNGPAPAAPDPCNLAADVLSCAHTAPDRIALVIVSPQRAERWSNGAIAAAVRGIGTGLLARGLVPGDRVLIRLGNSLDFPLCHLGAITAGMVPVPTAAALTGPEITRVARLVAPALIVAAPGIALPDHPAPVLGAEALRAMRALPPCPFALGPPDRLAYIVMTSGSGGTPRAVMHAHRAHFARRMMWADWYGLTGADRLMHAGAFNWTFTLGTGLLDPWSAGATALIPDEGVSPAQVPLLMRRHDVTVFASAPGVYRQLLKSGDRLDLPRLRHGLSAGEAMPDSLRARWMAATGRPVLNALGMTECSTYISEAPDRPAPPGAAGWAQRGRRVAVLGCDGVPVARDEVGELAVHRSDPGLFLGYLGEDSETMARFSGDWFRTGDMVSMATDGAITCHGRADEQMNPGGFRVSPLEVEAALAGAPGIQEIAVTEVALGPETRVIAAFCVAPAALDETALAAFAAKRLARYKQPRVWHRVEALPQGANGKIRRRDLAAAWEAAHGPA